LLRTPPAIGRPLHVFEAVYRRAPPAPHLRARRPAASFSTPAQKEYRPLAGFSL